MKLRNRANFDAVRTEGAILPPDILERIQQGDADLGGLKPKDYHLQPGERLNEAISSSWNRMQAAWRNFQADLDRLPKDDLATTVTRERLLLILFQELGYGRLQTTKALAIDGKSYPVSHMWGKVPTHLLGARVDLDKRMAGVAGAARSSPHSMVQDLLNRSEEHLWAFVSNGLKLRILRDNLSLVRQAYVEFDLAEIFEGESYADFSLLWLLCHQSRVEGEQPEEFWLERWSQRAQEQGARARDQLRDGVEQAISTLGQGFLQHPANAELRDALHAGELDKQEYYRQLLRFVYRLIFLFAAEDRDLLHPPESDHRVRERYRDFYSTTRLRRQAGRLRGGWHGDLYETLKLVMTALGQEGGRPEIGLPALGSFLWSPEAITYLANSQLSNAALLEAVRSLAFTRDGGALRPVDYKNLGAEELGSVYESLLELEPELNLEAATFELRLVGGSERKTTGSYYTPASLINQLLNTALDPVVEEALKDDDPETALLDLKICDPACGSGHFLIAAAHRLAKHLATVQTGDPEPSPEATRSALRQVIGRCIYGVDLNSMAVELCKVNLWLEALEPGKPLSFLDHHIQPGNSLLGATPALIEGGIPDDAFRQIEGDEREVCKALRKQNKAERSGQMSMFEQWAAEERETYQTLSLGAQGLTVMEEDSLAAQREKRAEFERLISSDEFRRAKLVADAWCAAFFWPKRESGPPPLTQAVFRRVATEPEDVRPVALNEIDRLADVYRTFHWHLAFPEVFQDGIPPGGDQPEVLLGGFDVVLGNPPWEHTELKEKEWFAGRRDDIAEASTGAKRKKMIKALREEDPALYQAYIQAKREHDAVSHFARHSGRYPLCGRGRINTYAIFAELNRALMGSAGRVGCIVPSGIATDDTTKYFFQELMERRSLVSLYDFENRRALFPASHRSYKFCLLTLTGPKRPAESGADFIFFALGVEDLRDDWRHFTLTAEEIELLNPNTRTCPIFRSKRDAELTKSIYRRVPVLIKEGPPEENPWGVTLKQGLFNMTSDSGLFRTREQLEAEGWELDGNIFVKGEWRYLPLYEAKMIHHFDHRFGDFRDLPEGSRSTQLPEVPVERKQDPDYSVLPRYWVREDDVLLAIEEYGDYKWLIAFRNIARVTDARSAIFSAVPVTAVGNSAPLVLPNPSKSCGQDHLLLSNLCTFVFDYIARQKVGGSNFNFYLAQQLPALQPKRFQNSCPWCPNQDLGEWLGRRVFELVYTSKDMSGFAEKYGLGDGSYKWDSQRRFLLKAELDAAFFHLYGLNSEDIKYVMDTFPIVKRKDIEEHGGYRTKRVILEIYDEMQRAIETGEGYETRLVPPPADPRVAHKL